MLLFDPAPEQLTDSVASYAFGLQPDEFRTVIVTVKCDHDIEEGPPLPFGKGLRASFQENKAASRGMATISTSNQVFNEMLCRSMADLSMLTTCTPRALTLTLASHGTRPRSVATGSLPLFNCCGAIPVSPEVCSAARRVSSERYRSVSRRRARKNPA